MRPIDADALIARYDRIHVGEPGKARKLIEEAPTIDAVPVDKISFADLYLANGEAIATFKFGNQGITLRTEREDVVQVVRCKDCRDYKQNPYSEGNEKLCMCWADWIPTEPDDFCSNGERKDDEH